jgi:hypothetical protein
MQQFLSSLTMDKRTMLHWWENFIFELQVILPCRFTSDTIIKKYREDSLTLEIL